MQIKSCFIPVILVILPEGWTNKWMIDMDEETKRLLRNIAHHLKWVIALLFGILALLIAEKAGGL